MGVHHRLHVGPRLVDAAVDEALVIERPAVVLRRRAVEVELHDVGLADHLGRERAGEEEAARVARMAHADVAVGIDDVFVREDAVRDHEVADEIVHFAHGFFRSEVRSNETVGANSRRCRLRG